MTATISALAAGTVAVRMLAPPATSPSWSGPVLFDSSVREALRIDSRSGRKTAADISDVLFAWEVLHPTVIDPLIFAWWLRESPFVAWQMMLIDAQAYAFTFLRWGGIAGTQWWISPHDGIAGILMAQRQMAFFHPLATEFKQHVHAAVAAR